MADSFSGLFGPDYGLSTQGTVTGGPFSIATTGIKYTWIVPFKAYVRRLALVVTQVPAGGGVVNFTRRVTDGSATGETTIGTVKTLSSHVAGNVIYLDLTTTVAVNDGDEITLTVGTGDANNTVCAAYVVVRQSPEVAGNITHMVATT